MEINLSLDLAVSYAMKCPIRPESLLAAASNLSDPTAEPLGFFENNWSWCKSLSFLGFLSCPHQSHLCMQGFFNCAQQLQQMLVKCRRSARGAFTQLLWNRLRSTQWLLIFDSAIDWHLLPEIRSYGEGNFVVPLHDAEEHPLLSLLGYKLAANLICIDIMLCSELENPRIAWQYILKNACREKDSVVLQHANDPRLPELLNQHFHGFQNMTVVPYNNRLHIVCHSAGASPVWRLLDGFLPC